MKRLSLGVFGVALLLAAPSIGRAQAVQVPISAFLDVQGSNEATSWTDPAGFGYLLFDAFGKRNAKYGLNLGTEVEGSVKVRPLADGTARVSIVVHTRNAACWGFQYHAGWTNPSPAFGYSPLYLWQYPATPASLGEGITKLEFTMPSPTAPLPRYSQLAAGDDDYPVELQSTVINCTGALRSGSGYPDGTPGAARTTQVGLFRTGVPAACPPEKDGDCFPTEVVTFWRTDR